MFDKLLHAVIRQRIFVLLATVTMAAIGLYNYQSLSIDAVPDITNVQVQINTEAPGFTPLEAEQRMRTMPSWLRDSFQFLDLGPKTSLVEARRRYRELAKKLHPDSGGTSQQMAALNDAWKKVEEFFLS